MTLNGVMTLTLHYFTAVGKPALQKTIFGGIYARVYCIFSACMSSQSKFTFAVSSPDEFLVGNRNSRLRSLYVIVRPSVYRLSVYNVRAPYSGMEIFSNISTPIGTLAIC